MALIPAVGVSVAEYWGNSDSLGFFSVALAAFVVRF
jgi:hypothetical protein